MATVPPLRKPSAAGVKVKQPKLPKTTKIDTVTGKGTPGGFSGASTKNPANESAKLKGDLTELQSRRNSQTATLEEKREAQKSIASKQTELKTANRAPNFSKGTVVTG